MFGGMEKGRERILRYKGCLDWIIYNIRLFSMQYLKELTKIEREKEESLQKKL